MLSSGSKKAKTLKTTSETALVAPVIKCDEEPKMAATAVSTMEE